MTKHTTTLSALTVLLASLALASCSKTDDARTARNDAGSDTAVVPGQPARPDAASKDLDRAKDAARQTAGELKSAATDAADQATNKVADALITTSVNAELAKDPSLSALHINVDTDSGRVALKGTAPDQASRERATQLASSVKGVVSVDNQLTVRGNG